MEGGNCRMIHLISSIITMGLQREQVKEIAQQPHKTAIIRKAIKHQARLRFHTESYIDPMDISMPFTEFAEWVKKLIPKDKFRIFLSLFKFPTQNIELTEKIYQELERVFDGRNAAVTFQFLDPTLNDDWEWYRHDVLNEPNVWHSKGWMTLQTAINSVMIVDLPATQTGDRPEPYFYFLGIENVIDFSAKGETLEWIIFKQPDNRIAEFDDEFMRLYELDNKGKVGELIVEVRHGLGYCPAKFFWTTPLSEEQPDIKKSPLSPQLGNLDWLLFFRVSKRHLDLYAPYPIYSAYAADCNYRNNETGDYCDGGFLRNIKGEYKVLRDGTVERCPICSEKRIAGVGSFIEVPIPKGDRPDLRDPITITSVDRNSLDYNTEEEKRLADEIYAKVTGTGGDVQQKESINEMQVTANFEDKKNVLLSLKTNFEKAQKFIDDTICRLRYGDMFVGSNINWGTEFYLYTVEDLQTIYDNAKKSGASESRLDMISDQIIETENRNNPQQIQRMFLLKQLEPYRHLTLSELQSLNNKQLIDPVMMLIKINFATFVDRFERENINILEFGSALPLDRKIQIITDKFKEYAKEQQSSITAGQVGGANGTGTAGGAGNQQQPAAGGTGAGTSETGNE